LNEAFWTFSLEFYQTPGVEGACLELQDRHGADVNLVLFALWAASCGACLDVAAIAEAERVARPWRETVTQPLRLARRALKMGRDGFDEAAVATLRRHVQADEIEAERLQQAAMARRSAFDACAEPRAAALHNLRLYETFLGGCFGPSSLEALLRAFDTRFG
jgi:uncharacterized protein (TIGR02444 family)